MRLRFLGRLTAATLAVSLAALPTAANAAPNPQLDKDQWWFDSWSVQQEVWPLTKGKGVTVAVIDSGVNASLSELQGAVLKGTDVRSSGDGQKDFSPTGHGTGMASLIAARGGKSGMMGVAPEAKILPVTAWKYNDQQLAAAIRYSVDHGAKVINMSVGESGLSGTAECPAEVFDAIAYAAKKNVVLVAAAGNSGDTSNRPEYPASCPGVLGVGAIYNTGKPWESTQRQPYVTVAGPGVVRRIDDKGRLGTSKGTSGASALISGAAALIRAHRPDLSARQVVQLLSNITKDVGPTGKDSQTGYGLPSVRRSLREKVPASAPNPVYSELDKALAAKGKSAASPSTKPSAAEQEDSGGSGMLLVGGVVVLLLIVGGGIGFVLLRKKPKQPTRPQPGTPPNFGAPANYPPPPNQSGGYPQQGQQPPGNVQAPPPPPPGY